MGRLSLLEHKEERALTGSRVSSGYQAGLGREIFKLNSLQLQDTDTSASDDIHPLNSYSTWIR